MEAILLKDVLFIMVCTITGVVIVGKALYSMEIYRYSEVGCLFVCLVISI